MPFIKKNKKTKTNKIQQKKTTNNPKNNNLKTKTKTNNKLNKPQKDIIKDILSPKVSNSNHVIVEQIQKLLKEIK